MWVRPVPVVGSLISLMGFVFFLTAVLTPNYYYAEKFGVQSHIGAFKICYKSASLHLDECKKIDQSCRADLPMPVGSINVVESGSCSKFNGVRVLLVMGMVGTLVASIAQLTIAMQEKRPTKFTVATISCVGLLSAIMGMISMALFVSLGQGKDRALPPGSFDFSFGLSIMAWICVMLGSLLFAASAETDNTPDIVAPTTAPDYAAI